MQLRVSTRHDGPRSVIAVAGEIDVFTAPELREQILSVINDGHDHMIIDLTGVGFMDSTGLGVLVGAFQTLQSQGGSLRLVCDQERLLKLFRITGMDRLLPIYANLRDAQGDGSIDLRDTGDPADSA